MAFKDNLTTPKVRQCLWRICAGSLPVKALLKHRHMIESDDCPWCPGHSETISHAFFKCRTVSDLWIECDCEDLPSADEEVDFKSLLVSWSQKPHQIIIERVKRLVEDYNKYNTKIYGRSSRTLSQSSSTWKAPPLDLIKINCDASLDTGGWIGLGVVARNAIGDVLFAGTRTRARWSPVIAECKALTFGLQLAHRHDLTKIIVETDCQVLINRITKNSISSADLDSLLEDILQASSNFEFISWMHVRRGGNAVTHALARLFPFGFEQVWENCCPREISSLVFMDNLSASL